MFLLHQAFRDVWYDASSLLMCVLLYQVYRNGLLHQGNYHWASRQLIRSPHGLHFKLLGQFVHRYLVNMFIDNAQTIPMRNDRHHKQSTTRNESETPGRILKLPEGQPYVLPPATWKEFPLPPILLTYATQIFVKTKKSFYVFFPADVFTWIKIICRYKIRICLRDIIILHIRGWKHHRLKNFMRSHDDVIWRTTLSVNDEVG